MGQARSTAAAAGCGCGHPSILNIVRRGSGGWRVHGVIDVGHVGGGGREGEVHTYVCIRYRMDADCSGWVLAGQLAS
jgi:hypothetical protein